MGLNIKSSHRFYRTCKLLSLYLIFQIFFVITWQVLKRWPAIQHAYLSNLIDLLSPKGSFCRHDMFCLETSTICLSIPVTLLYLYLQRNSQVHSFKHFCSFINMISLGTFILFTCWVKSHDHRLQENFQIVHGLP